ncbi:outer membrane receptor protein [Pseudorhodoferax sp. Leaf274]|nr:outer membrane receptor protein [Pseudorhodoferax sp. Leaf274]
METEETADGALTLRAAGTTNATSAGTLGEVRVVATAEQALRQALGSSRITQEDLQRRPPANDLAEILRTQPGVNLTGASSTGAYGNNRQIDLRGMGPENTLILIDGKPVNSRDAAMMRRSGERDTHGDTNWVPADAIESVEIIRGPAAARYGSGAAGGVVNIVTKKPADQLTGSVTTYLGTPQHGDEGNGTQRLGFNLAGPLSDRLSFRLYGNVAKTDANAPGINAAAGSTAAGIEGTRNRDVDGLLRWQLTPDQLLEFEAGISRQGNIYTGEYPVSTSADGAAIAQELANAGAEVRRTYRQTASATHRGNWGTLGRSRLTLQLEDTRNVNCTKATAGGPEGSCSAPLSFTQADLSTVYLNGELNTPLKIAGLSQTLTSGFEVRHQKLDDPNATQQASPTGSTATGSTMEARSYAMYLEDNIAVADRLMLTPGLRLDYHDQFGSNWSPSLNATYELSDAFTLKGGVARVFKAPNLYQTNPDYWYTTRGNGCPSGVAGPCYIQGNPDLQPEISVNQELGLAWNNHAGWDASLAYFRNDYQNKIVSDMPGQTVVDAGTYRYFQWHNGGPALIHGLEGNFNVPLLGSAGRTLKLINNFTWMFSNKTRETGQPVTVIPKYTLNSTLDWRVGEKVSAQFTSTLYGRQKPRTVTSTGTDATGAQLDEVGSYALFGIGATYQYDRNLRLGAGVSNLLDKRIQRRSNNSAAGAQTYNEPGRAFYVTMTAGF